MLLGYRTASDTAADLVVTDVLPAGPQAIRERVRFASDGEWQQRRLEDLYEKSGRVTTFLGDWHTHPRGGVRPSKADRGTFRTVAKAKDSRTRLPLMLIIGLWDGKRATGAYLIDTRGRPHEIMTVESSSASAPIWQV